MALDLFLLLLLLLQVTLNTFPGAPPAYYGGNVSTMPTGNLGFNQQVGGMQPPYGQVPYQGVNQANAQIPVQNMVNPSQYPASPYGMAPPPQQQQQQQPGQFPLGFPFPPQQQQQQQQIGQYPIPFPGGASMPPMGAGNWQTIMLNRLNQVRMENRVNPPLCLSRRLNALAQQQAEVLKNASASSFIQDPHTFPPGTTPRSRYQPNAPPNMTRVSENVAMVTYNDALKVNQYLEETDIPVLANRGHFLNMIDPKVNAVGLGMASGPMIDRNTGAPSSTPYYFWVQIFTDEGCAN